ncbi:hypothetical protein [Nocardia salmonicida]|uniref:hypothetical protein n=1 Tax=Nocardia salmonicida TaxID=53431 RepID=UPI003CEF1D23
MAEYVPSFLRITVHTVCVVGANPTDSHDVDLDTVTDEYGIPFVPKNRMSARLRDAALTVLTTAAKPGDNAVQLAIDLFGGAFTTSAERRMLQVGAAVWPRAAQANIVRAIDESRHPGLLRQ